MKTLRLGQYQLTIHPIGCRHWYTISWGNTVLKRGHEKSEHRSTMKALDKLKDILI